MAAPQPGRLRSLHVPFHAQYAMRDCDNDGSMRANRLRVSTERMLQVLRFERTRGQFLRPEIRQAPPETCVAALPAQDTFAPVFRLRPGSPLHGPQDLSTEVHHRDQWRFGILR